MRIATPEPYRTPVLRSLCVSGASDLDGVARRSGILDGIVHGELVAAESLGLVSHCEATGRWSLTAGGRVAVRRLLSHETTGCDLERLIELRGRLDELERVIDDLMSQWFLREYVVDGEPAIVINDHRDAAYDAAVLDDIAASHPDLIAAICATGALVPRLKRYAGRLADAWRRVRLGEHAALGDPNHDAYFDVWAEFLRDVDGLVA